MTVGVTGPTAPLDGGDGADTARYNGTAEADKIAIARTAPRSAFVSAAAARRHPGVESLIVSGLDGDDTIAGQQRHRHAHHPHARRRRRRRRPARRRRRRHLIGGNGNDLVDGNIGADHATLGAGDDHFQWDPGDGSDTVEGQGGNDRWTSTAPTSASRSTSPPTAAACG